MPEESRAMCCKFNLEAAALCYEPWNCLLRKKPHTLEAERLSQQCLKNATIQWCKTIVLRMSPNILDKGNQTAHDRSSNL